MNTLNTARVTFPNAIEQGGVLSDEAMEAFLAKVEGSVEVALVTRKENKFFAKDLYEILCSIMGIDLTTWRKLVEARGMRPVKAAIKLGACPNIAQLVGDLRLAVTGAEIDTVYADDRCKSCMTGAKVGSFWESNNVGVIYAPNFRLLVGLRTKGLNPQAYGFKGDKVYDILKHSFNRKEFPVESDYRWSTNTVVVNFEIKEELIFNISTVRFEIEPSKVHPDFIEALIHRGRRDNKEGNVLPFITPTKHNLPFPAEGSYVLTERYNQLASEDFSVENSLQEGEFVSKNPGFHFVGEEGGLYKFLEVRKVKKTHYVYGEKDQVTQVPIIKSSRDYYYPFIDFEEEVLSEEEAKIKIERLGLTLIPKAIEYEDNPF